MRQNRAETVPAPSKHGRNTVQKRCPHRAGAVQRWSPVPSPWAMDDGCGPAEEVFPRNRRCVAPTQSWCFPAVADVFRRMPYHSALHGFFVCFASTAPARSDRTVLATAIGAHAGRETASIRALTAILLSPDLAKVPPCHQVWPLPQASAPTAWAPLSTWQADGRFGWPAARRWPSRGMGWRRWRPGCGWPSRCGGPTALALRAVARPHPAEQRTITGGWRALPGRRSACRARRRSACPGWPGMRLVTAGIQGLRKHMQGNLKHLGAISFWGGKECLRDAPDAPRMCFRNAVLVFQNE